MHGMPTTAEDLDALSTVAQIVRESSEKPGSYGHRKNGKLAREGLEDHYAQGIEMLRMLGFEKMPESVIVAHAHGGRACALIPYLGISDRSKEHIVYAYLSRLTHMHHEVFPGRSTAAWRRLHPRLWDEPEKAIGDAMTASQTWQERWEGERPTGLGHMIGAARTLRRADNALAAINEIGKASLQVARGREALRRTHHNKLMRDITLQSHVRDVHYYKMTKLRPKYASCTGDYAMIAQEDAWILGMLSEHSTLNGGP